MKKTLVSFLLCSIATIGLNAQTYPYQDKSLSFHERAKDLVKRMKSVDDKVAQMVNATPSFTTKDGVTIPGYQYWNEALHGVARQGIATCFPESKAMSATWDRQLIFDCAVATSTEARIRHVSSNRGLNYWCPTINMSRDPRWGRDEENYGEDPFLTGTLAVEFVKGMQGEQTVTNPYYKTIATVKHFACNNYEGGRHNTSSNVTERMLREYYLPAFEMAVKEANVRSVMAAYNAVNGVPCAANEFLLTKILKEEWGFNGFVTSDCAGVEDIYNKHKYLNCTPEQAVAWSVKAGCDLNCGSTYGESGASAVKQGLITEEDLDSALVRIFEARMSMGEFDSNIQWDNDVKGMKMESDEYVKLSLKAAQEAIVLLKNDGILPLKKDKTVAVIGPYAQTVQLGGYAGSPSQVVSPGKAISEKVGSTGGSARITATEYNESKSKLASNANQGSNLGNCTEGHYACYDNVNFGSGKTKLEMNCGSRYDGRICDVFIDGVNGTKICTVTFPNLGNWTSYKTVTMDITKISGVHDVYLVMHKLSTADDTNKYVGNITWFRFFNEGEPSYESTSTLYLADGCSVGGAKDDNMVAEALDYAKKADYVVFIGGTDLNESDESRDRKNLNLPGYQQQLLEQIYAVNPNTVLVMESCSSHTINWANEHLPAIVEAWYDGQMQGQAIADVLYGDVNPSGKLTSTWYNSLNDLPSGFLEYNIDQAKYTYMYYDKTPLYPFGYGMSYTTYDYRDMQVSSETLKKDETINVTATIANTGNMDGAEIVQLYAVYNDSKVSRPKKQLVGFARIDIKAGQSAEISIPVRHDQLAYFNEETHTFDVEDGSVTLELAASSADVRLLKTINTTAAVVKTTHLSDIDGIAEHIYTSKQLNKNDVVYSITGTPLAVASEYDLLPSGIYLLNGQKYIKK